MEALQHPSLSAHFHRYPNPSSFNPACLRGVPTVPDTFCTIELQCACDCFVVCTVCECVYRYSLSLRAFVCAYCVVCMHANMCACGKIEMVSPVT